VQYIILLYYLHRENKCKVIQHSALKGTFIQI